MSLLRVVIVDDEPQARAFLAELLAQTERVELVGACESAAAAQQVLATTAVDAIFIDVQLRGARDTGGLQLAAFVHAQHPQLAVVLATASAQHALTAFELGVVDYLHKPFTQERVEACLDRLVQRRPAPAPPARPATTAPKIIAARARRDLVLLPFEEVLAFEAVDRLVHVHSDRGRFDIDLSLASVEAAHGDALLRVHRAWLVVRDRVQAIERADGEQALVLRGGLTVPVARDRWVAVRAALLAATTGLRD